MMKGFSIIAAIAMLVLVGDVRGQAIAVEDPTGGVAPAANYCIYGAGGCFTSLKAAEDAMRVSVPNVGQYLRRVGTTRVNNEVWITYGVPSQPPETYFPSTYVAHTGSAMTNLCPNSLVSSGYRCADENELIAGYIEKVVQPGQQRWIGVNLRVNENPRVEGEYTAYDYASGGVTRTGALREGYPYERIVKSIAWDDRNLSTGQVFTARMHLSRTQVFECPLGMESKYHTFADQFPYFCWSPQVSKTIVVKQSLQTRPCEEGSSGCSAGSGNASYTETDAVFAGRTFDRNYHSLRETAPLSSSMGGGWTHTYSEYLLPITGGRAIMTAEGHWAPMASAGNGGWMVPSLGNAPVSQLTDGTWKVVRPSGDVHSYSSSRLSSITNARDPSKDVKLFYLTNGVLDYVEDAQGRRMNFAYDNALVLKSVTLPDGQKISYGYNSSGNLASVDYGSGTTKQYHYGEQALATNGDVGLLTGVTGEDGKRSTSFGYDTYGRAVVSGRHASGGQSAGVTRINYTALNGAQVIRPTGSVRNLTYTNDAYRRPLTIADSVGTVTSTYDSYGRTLTRTNANGAQDRYTYTNGKLTSAASAFGTTDKRTQETVWHATLALPTQQRTLNATGQVVSQTNLTYSATGQLLTTTSTDPVTTATRTTTRAYCEQADVDVGACPRVGLLKSVDGSRTDVADTAAYTYYGTVGAACSSTLSGCGYRPGDLWKVTDALGRVSEILAYDAAGRPLAVKDANGVVTETLYYPRGWVATVTVKGATSAGDRITSYEYWPTGLVKKITDPDGVYTTYEYDNAQRMTAIADSAGNRIEYTLDGAGNRVGEATKGAGGTLKRTLSRVYNTLGQLATQADAQANPTDFIYDANGNRKTVTDALGHVTSNDYDPLNRLKRTLQDVGGIEAETKFTYDANDNLTKVTDPKGLDTTYTYNGFGDQVQLSSPDTGVTSFTYDSAGNRASQTDARGITTTYQYDALNRLTQVGYPTTSLNVAYTYDVTQPVCQAGETFSIGRLTLMVDGSGSTQYCHDRFGQLVRKVQTANGVALTLQYAYTKSGQLQAMTYPDGTVADYVRNTQGQVTGVGVTRPGQAREVLLHQATYHPFGPIAGWVYGNGRTMQRNVDLDYRPTSIQGGAGGLDLTYGYDEVGNLTSLASGSPPPMEYGYDALGRLTETRDAPTQAIIDQYAYDKTGNRTSYTDSLGTKAYAYPSTSHRLSSVAGENRTYDAVGNTLSIGAARAFDYNDAGRMSQVRNGGVVAMEYAYNGRGEQVRKHLGATETQALYDEAGHWLGDYGTSGVVSQQAIWMDDMPVGVLDGGQLYYIQPDHLGTPRTVIDPTRNVAVWRWDSKGEAFGNTSPEQDVDGDSATFVLDMRFPGQRYDGVSGISYNYFRDYDPNVGRYMQSDPIGLHGGPSAYGYAEQSPFNLIDPFGLKASSADCAKRCAAKVLGFDDLIDVGLVVSGQPIPGTKRFVTPGSSRGTSIAGMAANEVFGSARSPVRLPTIVGGPGTGRKMAIAGTKSIARFAGRAVPLLGWGLLAVDAIQFAMCMNDCMGEDCQ
jgi:RHS repeat-associated protein